MHPVIRRKIGEFAYGIFALFCIVGVPVGMILTGLLFG